MIIEENIEALKSDILDMIIMETEFKEDKPFKIDSIIDHFKPKIKAIVDYYNFNC